MENKLSSFAAETIKDIKSISIGNRVESNLFVARVDSPSSDAIKTMLNGNIVFLHSVAHAVLTMMANMKETDPKIKTAWLASLISQFSEEHPKLWNEAIKDISDTDAISAKQTAEGSSAIN